MFKLTIAYTAVTTWTFGWLSGRFGFLPSLFAAFTLFIPTVLAWRMLESNRTINRRGYAYLGLVTVLASGATIFVVAKWYDAGMDRLAVFDREYHEFQNRVNSMAEYKSVEVSCTHRKGGRVYLHGYVTNKESHDRLLQMMEWMVRYNDSGFYDGVEYPGQPTESEDVSGVSNGEEP